jgi:hypothetical protein
VTAARDEARKLAEKMRPFLARDGEAHGALDALVALVERAERERNKHAQAELHWYSKHEAAEARVVQLQQERDQLAEALRDQGVDPVDYILTRPSWEERREAAKCLFAASVMADGYGKPETAAKFRAAAESLKTGDLAALAASRRAGES